ncbi:hypothetical protein G6F32_013762 [Rhizopus arrhizus]|nr:hypothetical protein G6F32_013762 [Rhizopus arrhizus]
MRCTATARPGTSRTDLADCRTDRPPFRLVAADRALERTLPRHRDRHCRRHRQAEPPRCQRGGRLCGQAPWRTHPRGRQGAGQGLADAAAQAQPRRAGGRPVLMPGAHRPHQPRYACIGHVTFQERLRHASSTSGYRCCPNGPSAITLPLAVVPALPCCALTLSRPLPAEGASPSACCVRAVVPVAIPDRRHPPSSSRNRFRMIPASLDSGHRMIADTLAAFRAGPALRRTRLRPAPQAAGPLYIGLAGAKHAG